MKKTRLPTRSEHTNSKTRGSTLIELLIAATVTVMVMTAVAISMMYSIQREAQNRYKETATTLAQDTLDLVQTKRAELGWEQFVSSYQTKFLCVNDLGEFKTPTILASCSNFPMTYGGLAFNRSVEFEAAAGGVKTTVIVNWQASSDPSTYEVAQTFYKGVY